jgi:uncharacterized membrane protein YbaN (DUF454 family)
VTTPHSPSRKRRSRTRNIVFAVFFFILGVIGVLVPVMPQVPFFIMSALFLSLAFPKVRRAIRRFRHRYPKLDASYKRWRARARHKRQAAIRRRRETSRHEKGHRGHPDSGA